MAGPGRRVLYTDPPWLVLDGRADPARADLEAGILGSDVELVFGPHEGGAYRTTAPALLHRAAGADVIVVYRCRVTPGLLDAAGPGLRAVIRHGVGVDNLAPDLLAERSLPAYNIPDYCVDEVSAHTTMLALALERALVPQHTGLVGGRFDIYAGRVPRRLSAHTLGIVGFGRIGRSVARKLGVHYGRTLVHDPGIGRDLAEGYGAHAVDTLAELLGASDMVTLHCPLTPRTERLMDRAAFEAMRDGAYLVNAARGALVDPGALADALDSRLAGAGLDVFAPENPHDDPAWAPVLAHPNAVVTSHRAFLSAEAELSSRTRAAELARDLLAGRRPVVGRVLPEVC